MAISEDMSGTSTHFLQRNHMKMECSLKAG